MIGFNSTTGTIVTDQAIQQGSPGNKNPAVLRYDPTGLRSTGNE